MAALMSGIRTCAYEIDRGSRFEALRPRKIRSADARPKGYCAGSREFFAVLSRAMPRSRDASGAVGTGPLLLPLYVPEPNYSWPSLTVLDTERFEFRHRLPPLS